MKTQTTQGGVNAGRPYVVISKTEFLKNVRLDNYGIPKLQGHYHPISDYKRFIKYTDKEEYDAFI